MNKASQELIGSPLLVRTLAGVGNAHTSQKPEMNPTTNSSTMSHQNE